MPKLIFCPPFPLPDPVPVAVAAAVLVVVEKVGSTNAVALLSQLKHTVSSAYVVPAKVVDASLVILVSGNFNVAPASSPISTITDGMMFVRFEKIWERKPLTVLDEVSGSHLALTLLRDDTETESFGRSRKTPAYMSPEPESRLTPRRTSELRPREKVTVKGSEEAVKGRAVTVDMELYCK
jgi:hypothetical protein